MNLVTKTMDDGNSPMVVARHLQGRKPDPRCTRAHGASVRHSTNTEPASASGAAGAAPCARRGLKRAPLLFGTSLPGTCALGDTGSHRVTAHAKSPVALDERMHPNLAPSVLRWRFGHRWGGRAPSTRHLTPGLGRSAGHW